MIIGVLVEVTNKNVDKVFDYKVPLMLESKIKKGVRVKVNFASRELEGFVVETNKKDTGKYKLKEIIDVIDLEEILTEEQLELGKWLSINTISSLVASYQVMLPKALKAKNNFSISKKYDIYYTLNDYDGNYKFNSKQQQIIDYLKTKKIVNKNMLKDMSSSSIKTLINNNIIKVVTEEKYRRTYTNKEDIKIKLSLNQQKVIDDINASSKSVHLIFGVTGSGKTEIYMHLIAGMLKEGKSALFLVPEISLTPQMIDRFERRFGTDIALLHSALSEGEKYDEYRRIKSGKAKIVIGARSAIFAPVLNLGLIVIDEEHSPSYKQDDMTPRYHTLDVAIKRAKMNNCKVILGSATPSLESFARACQGVYKLHILDQRINDNKLPKVDIVDMNSEIKNRMGHFSTPLIKEIENTLNKNEQVILLLNRRGYSTFMSCKNCGETLKCPNCDITLTYHKDSNILRCHYCGYATKYSITCPSCNEQALTNLGVGTEKIEEEIKHLFPNSRICRMDIDTTSRKGSHKKMIDDFKNHNYDILLGTQIVAKGLDFNNVTLVGIINADTSLNIPDFRSSENTFSLLSQTAGRSGRSKDGKAIIQTFNPTHYAIRYVKNHNYLGFYKEEMNIRKMLKYPPYYYLVQIKISSKDNNLLQKEVVKIKKSLENHLSNTIILGPTSSYIFRLNKIYRYGIILKYKKEENLYATLNMLNDYYKSNQHIKVDIDFNPISF